MKGGLKGGGWRDEAEERRMLERGENSIREKEMKEMWVKHELFARNEGGSGSGSSVVTAVLHYELRCVCQGYEGPGCSKYNIMHV
jgi:hypothetical protein